jgi:hypothetical protein
MASGIDYILESFLVSQTSCFLATTSAFSFTAASGIGIRVAGMPQIPVPAKSFGVQNSTKTSNVTSETRPSSSS